MFILAGVADRPAPLPYATPGLNRLSRQWVSDIELLLPDRVVWESQFTVEQQLLQHAVWDPAWRKGLASFQRRVT